MVVLVDPRLGLLAICKDTDREPHMPLLLEDALPRREGVLDRLELHSASNPSLHLHSLFLQLVRSRASCRAFLAQP